jgi:hypothetical protein
MVEMQEGYFVDNQGNVYSNRKFTKLTLIKQHKDAYGYLRVKLLGQTKKTHRLVATAFVPNPEDKPTVNHINGVKTDNRADNLEWCSYSENKQHAYDAGITVGYTGIKDKGNNKYYKEWKKQLNSGCSMREIGQNYGVSHRTVGNVIKKFDEQGGY